MRALPIAILIISVITACNSSKGSSDDSTSSKSVEELLKNENGWKMVDSKIVSPNGEVIDAMYIFEECELDDIEYYMNDSVTLYDEGPTKCDPSDQQLYYDKYVLINDSVLVILFQEYNMTDTMYITDISEDSMTNVSYEVMKGVKYKYIDVFTSKH